MSFKTKCGKSQSQVILKHKIIKYSHETSIVYPGDSFRYGLAIFVLPNCGPFLKSIISNIKLKRCEVYNSALHKPGDLGVMLGFSEPTLKDNVIEFKKAIPIYDRLRSHSLFVYFEQCNISRLKIDVIYMQEFDNCKTENTVLKVENSHAFKSSLKSRI